MSLISPEPCTNPIAFEGTLSVALDCETDSVTICPGPDPIPVTDNGGSLTVDATNLDTRDLVFATDKVDVSGSTVSVTEPVSVDDNGGSLTVDGTVEIGAASLAALESITVQNPGGASAVNIQDGGNSITVDGTVTVNQPVAVTDNGGSLTVDNPTLSVVGGGTEATALRVTVATDSTGVLSVDDNGGSLTVDGTVELGATSLAALESITVQNGAGASAVNIQDGGNSITVDGTITANAGTGTFTVGDGGGSISVDDNGGSLTVDGSVTTTETYPVGTLNNGAETAVSSSAVQVLAANASRKKLILQNTGAANVRVGTTGLTTTTGFKLGPDGVITFDMPHCPTNAIFAIRTSTVDSTILAQEVV